MGNRRLAREYCIQGLYLMDVANLSCDDVIQTLEHCGPLLEPKSTDFAASLIHGAAKILKKIDKLIQSHAHNWQIGRLASVDRCILRLASYELIMTPDTPVKVIIDEAIELAKKYSTEDSGGFVNGILDQMKKERGLKKKKKRKHKRVKGDRQLFVNKK